MTKKEMFAEIIAMVQGLETKATAEEIIAFANHEIELLNNKKSSNKPSAKQLENETYKTAILEILRREDKPLTISNLMEFEPLTALKNQRVSALVTQLKNENKVHREEIKKVAYFTIVE